MKLMAKLKSVGILMLFALAVGVFLYFFGGKIFDTYIVKTISFVESHAQLESDELTRKMEGLRVTSEFVFPFDFIEPPYPNWSRLLLKDAALHTPADREQLAIYHAMKDLGYDLARNSSRFVIVSATASLGYDFARHPVAVEQEEQEDGSTKLVIYLPKAELLDFIINDSMVVKTGYPRVVIDAQGWQQLINYLEPELRQRMVTDELLYEARNNLKTTIMGALNPLRSVNFEIKDVN